MPPSDLVTRRSGAATTGVVSVPVLLLGVGSGPLVPSSAIVTVFAPCVTPAGNALSTRTLKVAVPLAPAARLATGSVHVDPGAVFGVQVHALLPVATK